MELIIVVKAERGDMMTTYRRRKDKDTWHWCRNCQNYPNNPDDVIVTKTGKERPSYGELDNECLAKEKKGGCTA